MNDGIFLTIPGVTQPVVTEMSLTNWDAYANNREVGIVRSDSLFVNAFEGFRYQVWINEQDANPVRVLFNNKANYVAQFTSGTGSHNASNGDITTTLVPARILEADKVFLKGSSVKIEVNPAKDVEGYIFSKDLVVGWLKAILDTGVSSVSVFADSGGVTVDGPDAIVFDQPAAPSAVLEVTELAMRVLDADDANAVLYTIPRTYQVKVQSGLVGVTMDSNGLATGASQPFNLTEGILTPNADVTGVVRVTSAPFGQVTDYNVSVGQAFSAPVGELGSGTFIEEDLTANQAAIIDVNSNFTGGIGTLQYSLVNGELPPGMTMTSEGLIQGVPTLDGEFLGTVKVEDIGGNEVVLQYKFTVIASANVNYNPTAGIEDLPYNFNPNITGIESAALTAGIIPPGLSLNAATGALSGTPTTNGTFSFTLTLGVNGKDEVVSTVLVIYSQMAAEVFKDGESNGLVESGDESLVNIQESVRVQVTGGSSQFQYGISGGNLISSNGTMQLFETGEVTVTVTDVITGQSISFILMVAGQADICGVAVEEEIDAESTNAPCVDVITDCNTPVNLAFPTLHLLKGIEPGEVAYREYPIFEENEGAEITNNGKPFVQFLSKAPNGFAVANNAKDGRPFLLEMAINASVANGITDVAIGVSRDFDSENGFASLDFAMVVTTVGLNRSVEIRKNNLYQTGSRFTITEGQQLGFAVFPDRIALYVDGLLKYSLTGTTFSCSGMDLVVLAAVQNMIVGGRAGNLLHAIDTPGTADQVGTIDATTGIYTPSLNNVGLVRISATSLVNPAVKYYAKVRVIRAAAKTSLEKAMLEGIPVDMWVASTERFDDLPLRLDREGRPDKNQVSNPMHLGTLQGSGRMESTLTRNEFRNDVGATSSSSTIDKVTITGAFLAVRNMALVKRLVPFMKEFNGHGVRQLKQYSTGCQPKMRTFLIWQSPDCEDVPVFDAIEVHNSMSYTLFNIEVGKAVQTTLPISIEGFPNKDGVLYDYNQYDKAFHRIGSSQ